MQLFYCESIENNTTIIPESEIHHLRVLRYETGDEIILMNGSGYKITATLLSIKKRYATATVVSTEKMESTLDSPFNLCIAPTKNAKRIEWVVEKAVEFGVSKLYFFSSFHSERKHLKLSRLRKKVLAACKQSYKWYIPELYEIKTIEEIMGDDAFQKSTKLIAHASEDAKNAVPIIQSLAHKPLSVMVGPEGDFSDEEITTAQQNGWRPVHLGTERLRTETAALYLTALNYSSQNK